MRHSPFLFDVFCPIEWESPLLDWCSIFNRNEVTIIRYILAGTITTGHSRPLAAWHVEIVTF
jgi:hypothetical protein